MAIGVAAKRARPQGTRARTGPRALRGPLSRRNHSPRRVDVSARKRSRRACFAVRRARNAPHIATREGVDLNCYGRRIPLLAVGVSLRTGRSAMTIVVNVRSRDDALCFSDVRIHARNGSRSSLNSASDQGEDGRQRRACRPSGDGLRHCRRTGYVRRRDRVPVHVHEGWGRGRQSGGTDAKSLCVRECEPSHAVGMRAGHIHYRVIAKAEP